MRRKAGNGKDEFGETLQWKTWDGHGAPEGLEEDLGRTRGTRKVEGQRGEDRQDRHNRQDRGQTGEDLGLQRQEETENTY